MKNVFETYESEVRSYCRKYPVVFDRACNSTIYSVDGRPYIDFLAVAGSMNYGHNNPEIKKAVLEYLSQDRIINALDMYTKAKELFLESITSMILQPRSLDYKIMCCGPTGTNGVEAAIKLARKNTKRSNVFAFSGGFHGMSLGALSLTTEQVSREGAGVSLSNVTFMPFDGTYGVNSAEYIKRILEDDHSGVEKPAAIILETVQAEGGINVSSVEWLKEIRDICNKFGILMIVDDIQVGCGRSGHFFSFERAGIVPDMVILSKSISGFGMPMSILLIKPEFDIFRPAEHNGTFRGNQLSFVGAAASFRYYNDHDLESEVQRKARIIQSFLEERIASLDSRIVIRGIGMLWGIDLMNIKPELALDTIHEAFSRGLICEIAGRKDSVVKIMPPLTIDDQLLLDGLAIIEESIKRQLESL